MPRIKIPQRTLDWCKAHGWTEPVFKGGLVWAYPSGDAVMRIPLPVQHFRILRRLKVIAEWTLIVVLTGGTIAALGWLWWIIIMMFLDAVTAVVVLLGPVEVNILWLSSCTFVIASAITFATALRPLAAKDKSLSELGLVLFSSFNGGLLASIGLLSSAVGAEKLIYPAIYNAVLFGIALLIALYRVART